MKTFALAALLLVAATPQARAADLGTLEASWPAREIERIQVEFPIGELIVETDDQPDIRAALNVRCRSWDSRCVERSKRLRLVSDRRGQTRTVSLDGMPRFGNRGLQITLRLTIPRSLAVDVEMGVGRCRVEGVTRDLSVELGVGQLVADLPQRDVRSVRLTVGVGDATLRDRGETRTVSGFLGRSVRWEEGPGQARVKVELGVGEASVRLN